MVCCHPCIRIYVILMVHEIVLETLSSSAIVRTSHVAPNFCSWPNLLYNEMHQNSGILTWNCQQKTFLGCRIITSKNPLLWYDSPLVVFFFLKISSRVSQLCVRGLQFGSSQLWNACS